MAANSGVDIDTIGVGVDTSGVKQGSSELDKFGKAADSASKKADQLGKQTKAQAERFTAMQKELSNTNRLLNEGIKMHEAVRASSLAAAGATNQQIDAIIKLERQIDQTNAKAEAFSLSLKAISAVAVAVAAGVGSMIMGLIDTADAMHDISTRTGIAVEQLVAWKLAAEQNGASMESLAEAFSKAGRYLVEHGDNLKKLGINAKTAEEVVLQLAGKLSSLPADDPRRVALAMEVLGRSAGNLIPLLSEGENKLRTLLETQQKMQGITTELANKSDLFNDKLSELKAAMTTTGASIANYLLPPATRFVQNLIDIQTQSNPTIKALESLKLAAKFAFPGFAMIAGAFNAGPQTLAEALAGGQARQGKIGGAPNAQGVDPMVSALQAQIDALLQAQNKPKKGPKDTSADDEYDRLVKLVEENDKLIEQGKKKLADQASAIDSLAREAAGWNQLTEVQRISWEIQTGRYKDFDDQTKQELLRLAAIRDLRTEQIRIDKDEADLMKKVHDDEDAQAEETIRFMKKKQDEQEAVWKSIEQIAHETWNSIFDSGKSAIDRLRDTLKNGLFDLLYQMTLKKWIINIGASITGSGIAGTAAAEGLSGVFGDNSSGTSSMGSIGNIISNGFSLLSGSVSESISGLAGTIGGDIGQALLGNAEMLGSAATGIGLAFAAASLFSGGLFGGGHVIRPKEYANTLIGVGGSASTLAAWTNSDGGAQGQAKAVGLGMAAAIQMLAKQFGSTISKEFVLGTKYSQKYNTLAYTVGGGASRDNADFTATAAQGNDAAALAFMFAVKRGKIKIDDYLERIIDVRNTGTARIQSATNSAAYLGKIVEIKQLHDSLADLPPVFAHVRDAIEQMTSPKMLDGIKALNAATENFYNLFTSDAQKFTDNSNFLHAQLGKLNVAFPDTRDGFRALVAGIDTTSKSGLDLYTALVNLATPMDAYFKALEAQATATDQSTLAAKAAADEQARLAALAGQRTDLMIRLYEVQGNSAAALVLMRQKEMDSMDASLRPLLQQIYAQEDYNTAMQKAKEATDALIGSMTLLTEDKFVTLLDYTRYMRQAQIAGIAAPDKPTFLPHFAAGGDFSGGLRLVGENGPELEVTGPSRITSNADLLAALRDPQSNSAAVIAELRAVRAELVAARVELVAARAELKEIKVSNRNLYRIEEKWDGEGLPATRA